MGLDQTSGTEDHCTFSFADVDFAVGNQTILSNVTVATDVKRIGVVGRNGSGKSTFARLLAGLVAPTKGVVRVASIDVSVDRKAAMRKVGILFQNPDHQIIFPTVQEEVAFGLKQLGQSKVEADDRVSATLAQFEKTHWTKANIHELSQGQKQLVCLMAIFAMSPDLVILDEPFSGLDIPTRLQLERYLTQIDGAVVHISHDPEVLRHSDHLIWIDAGKVEMAGTPEEILPAFTAKMHEIGGQDDISHLSR